MIFSRSIELGGRTLTIEQGRIARQADGAVTIRYGETVVLVTACAARTPKEGINRLEMRDRGRGVCPFVRP